MVGWLVGGASDTFEINRMHRQAAGGSTDTRMGNRIHKQCVILLQKVLQVLYQEEAPRLAAFVRDAVMLDGDQKCRSFAARRRRHTVSAFIDENPRGDRQKVSQQLPGVI